MKSFRYVLLLIILSYGLFLSPNKNSEWVTDLTESAEAAETIEVILKDNFFEPKLIRVKPGDTIQFKNLGKQLHSVTLVGHEEILDQLYIDPGKSFSFVVPKDMKPGEYPLGCNIHMGMKGKIEVNAPK
ncbi:MAG: cupredoxin domain-containing protein [Nitrospira sp.]|nr:cupredoxin domain-containing protein [Nitrospira sp.]